MRKIFVTLLLTSVLLVLGGRPATAAVGPLVDPVGGQVVVGVPAEFTFWSRTPGTAAYRYRFLPGLDWQQVAADENGSARVTVTPSVSGASVLDVVAISPDGSSSPTTSHHVLVADPRPQVRTSWELEPSGGATGFFEFSSDLYDVNAFVYRVDDGPERTLAADGGRAFTDYVADIGGRHLLTVRSRTTVGELSPPTEHVFVVSGAPRVTSMILPDGWTRRFTFAPFLPDVVAYGYRFHSLTGGAGSDQEVPAVDGTATITWTPPRADSYTLVVWAVTAGGDRSERTDVLFTVPEQR